MTTIRALSKLTRQELYDLVWSTPGSKLSKEFGVSDVAIAKRCKRLGFPRPSRGYWAKLGAGKKPRKPPLPPTADELFAQAAGKPVGKSMQLPQGFQQLHPIAVDLMRTISAAKADSQKRVNIRQPTLPNAMVSKALAERIAQAFHAIVTEAGSRGIPFRKGQSSYDGGFFRKGNDRLHLEFEEELVEKPATHKRSRGAYNWSWQSDSPVPSGKLTVSLNTDRYSLRNAKRWIEGDQLSLEQILAKVVQEICRHFVDAQERRAQEAVERKKQRVEWEERQKKWQEEEVVRQKEKRERKHAEAIETVMRHRKDDLLKAAEWWRLHQLAHQFIAECESRWRAEQTNDLKPAEEEWLDWAWKTSNSLSPFETGYPEPARDGAFSSINVPIGGPYPLTREFSRPPTMPKIPAPGVVQQSDGASNYQPPQPYPFWLKYPQR